MRLNIILSPLRACVRSIDLPCYKHNKWHLGKWRDGVLGQKLQRPIPAPMLQLPSAPTPQYFGELELNTESTYWEEAKLIDEFIFPFVSVPAITPDIAAVVNIFHLEIGDEIPAFEMKATVKTNIQPMI